MCTLYDMKEFDIKEMQRDYRVSTRLITLMRENQMIKDGIAELLDESFVVEQMPQKQEVEQDTVYIPVPVPMSYFNEQEQEEGIIKPKKINKYGNYWHY